MLKSTWSYMRNLGGFPFAYAERKHRFRSKTQANPYLDWNDHCNLISKFLMWILEIHFYWQHSCERLFSELSLSRSKFKMKFHFSQKFLRPCHKLQCGKTVIKSNSWLLSQRESCSGRRKICKKTLTKLYFVRKKPRDWNDFKERNVSKQDFWWLTCMSGSLKSCDL